MEKFRNYHNDNTTFFSLNGLKTDARVVSVTDGDTLVLIVPVFDKYYKFSTRISGIDTCEVHSKNLEAKDKGLDAKIRVIELLTSRKVSKDITRKQVLDIFMNNVYTVYIECQDFDKYGRLLADVFVKDKKLSDILLEEKLAYKYEGSTKLSEEEQLKILE